MNSLPEIQHDAVVLRYIRESDLAAWLTYLTHPLVCEQSNQMFHNECDLRMYVSSSVRMSDSQTIRLAIALRTTDALVGTVGYHTISPRDRRAELAYDLSPEIWGHGVATQAVKAFLQWGHDRLDLLRIQATVLPTNTRSLAVLQRVGFQFEGVLRAYRLVRGVPRDYEMHSHCRTSDDHPVLIDGCL